MWQRYRIKYFLLFSLYFILIKKIILFSMKNMEIRNSLLFVLFIQCISFLGMSQKIVANQKNAWVLYTGNHKISKKLGIHTEYQWRRADFFNDWQQSLLRVGLDYYHNPNISFTAGYASIILINMVNSPLVISHMKTVFGNR